MMASISSIKNMATESTLGLMPDVTPIWKYRLRGTMGLWKTKRKGQILFARRNSESRHLGGW
jgi:hypothetical protein